jgi:hypothetical protein
MAWRAPPARVTAVKISDAERMPFSAAVISVA